MGEELPSHDEVARYDSVQQSRPAAETSLGRPDWPASKTAGGGATQRQGGVAWGAVQHERNDPMNMTALRTFRPFAAMAVWSDLQVRYVELERTLAMKGKAPSLTAQYQRRSGVRPL